MSATEYAMYAAMAYGVFVIGMSLYCLTLAGLQWLRFRTQRKEQEQFLRKACIAMGADYERVDIGDLMHLIKTIDISIRVAKDRRRVAMSHPVARLIYETRYADEAENGKAK